MTDIKMLPLPEYLYGREASDNERVVTVADAHAYAVRNVAHATAAKDAEIESLRAVRDSFQRVGIREQERADQLQAELDNRWAQGVHTCHDKCQRIACVLRRDNKRLAEELRMMGALLDEVRSCFTRDDDLPDNLLPRIDAALRDHDQEGKDG